MYYHMKNPHGGDLSDNIILDYSINTNPLGTPPEVLAAAGAALARSDRYPDPYCLKLVRALAAYEGVPPEYVLCGNGAAELIYAFCAALQPKCAVELAPTFSEYAAAAEAYGCRVERYALREETGFLPDAGFADFVREKQPEALFLCTPNNPTGRLFPRERMEELLRLCASNRIRLLVDECFLELSADGEALNDALAEHPELFLLKAFTKSYALAGLRLGYCLSSDAALLKRMSALTSPWNVSGPAQEAGIAATGGREHLERARELLRTERPRLKGALEALGLRVIPSEANFLLFRGPESLRDDLWKRGIAVRDCGNFPGLGPGWYRAAVRTREENDRLISELREVLEWHGI